MLQIFYKKFTRTQMIIIGFLIIIFTGTLLLMLPVSNRSGEVLPFLDALFTATSATCVTGLVVRDTCLNFTLFGQLVILAMIQIGGLGFMTVGVFFSIILRRKIGLRTRGMLQESVNTLQIGGIVRLTKKIIKGTILFEGLGALALSVRFIGDFGVIKGIYYSVFHSISAFCNAGFDLMGINEEYASLTSYYSDPVVNLTIMILITVGGIGFLVWDDVSENKLRLKNYKLHSKIVIIASFFLIFGGSILFYIFERNNLFGDMSFKERVLSSMFSSVTARTAGFNTVDTAGLTDSSKMLTIVLMFIGGSPGSTAGGIKTTTLVVLLVYLRANIKKINGCNIFHRRLGEETIKKASAVLCTNLILSICAIIFICAAEVKLNLTDVMFEVFSAIGTVGMSAGITRQLNEPAQLAIIFLMYSGRIGSLSFALSMGGNKKTIPVMQPVEEITIG